MRTTSFSVAIPTARIDPSSAPGDGMEAHRLGVRQAAWRVRLAERRLGTVAARLEGLTQDAPDHAPAVAEVHRRERALFNRRLELREACEKIRRHLPGRSTLDPEGWPPPRVPLAGK